MTNHGEEIKSTDDTQQAIARVKAHLETQEGARQLRQMLDDAKATSDQLRRDAQVDPKSLREPMTL